MLDYQIMISSIQLLDAGSNQLKAAQGLFDLKVNLQIPEEILLDKF